MEKGIAVDSGIGNAMSGRVCAELSASGREEHFD